MEGLDEGHLQELPKSKEVQEILQVMRNHPEGQDSYYPGLHSISSNFLTLVA